MQHYDPKQPVSITAKASAYLVRQALQHQRAEPERHQQGEPEQADTAAKVVRLSVKTTGCSGYQYQLDWVAASQNSDIPIHLNESLYLYVDAAAVSILQGTEIDLIKEGLNESIEFKNPNVTARCGCGESFSITA
jgi:iron-sulfur cluster assembly accessory protein